METREVDFFGRTLEDVSGGSRAAPIVKYFRQKITVKTFPHLRVSTSEKFHEFTKLKYYKLVLTILRRDSGWETRNSKNFFSIHLTRESFFFYEHATGLVSISKLISFIVCGVVITQRNPNTIRGFFTIWSRVNASTVFINSFFLSFAYHIAGTMTLAQAKTLVPFYHLLFLRIRLQFPDVFKNIKKSFTVFLIRSSRSWKSMLRVHFLFLFIN